MPILKTTNIIKDINYMHKKGKSAHMFHLHNAQLTPLFQIIAKYHSLGFSDGLKKQLQQLLVSKFALMVFNANNTITQTTHLCTECKVDL